MDVDDIAAIIAPDAGPYLVSTEAVAVENTHNFGGGTVQDVDQLAAVGALCQEPASGYHLDGARLWNAHVATGVPLADYGRLFDTVSVCFSKGLGAPVGSMLVSTAERIAAGPGVAQAAGRGHAAGRHPGRRGGVRAGPPPGAAGRRPRRGPYAFAAAVAERAPAAVERERRARPTSWCSTPAHVPAAAVAAAGRRSRASAYPPSGRG